MADTLVPGGILMRICPKRLHRWASLCETAVYSWLDDRAPTMGAAIAYYMVFSLASRASDAARSRTRSRSVEANRG